MSWPSRPAHRQPACGIDDHIPDLCPYVLFSSRTQTLELRSRRGRWGVDGCCVAPRHGSTSNNFFAFLPVITRPLVPRSGHRFQTFEPGSRRSRGCRSHVLPGLAILVMAAQESNMGHPRTRLVPGGAVGADRGRHRPIKPDRMDASLNAGAPHLVSAASGSMSASASLPSEPPGPPPEQTTQPPPANKAPPAPALSRAAAPPPSHGYLFASQRCSR